MVAISHSSKGYSKDKKDLLYSNYEILEFLGDSVIKFLNCKRIISMKEKLVKNKEKEFSDIKRLKFVKTAAEKNQFLAFVCMKTGIYSLIRHKTENQNKIDKYKEYLDEHEGEIIDLKEVDDYSIKMLADVVESVIGAILLDSSSITKTENAWKKLLEEYLINYADNPAVPPKRAFTKA